MEQQKDGSFTDGGCLVPADRAHHAYSPSTLQSIEACPCFVGRQDVVHVRTVIGTIAHNAAEKGEDDNRLDDEDAVAVAECLDFYEKRRQLASGHREEAQALSEDPKVAVPHILELKETYLPVDDVSWEESTIDFRTGEKSSRRVDSTTAGYIDAAIISHDRTYAEIFDWKFGMWAVESAENNLQGLAYALGMLKHWASLKAVRFWFKQPHLDGEAGLTGALVRRSDVPGLYLRIQTVVERARRARASGNFDMARPMVPNCNFCANVGVCTKVTEFACRVGSKFHPLGIPADITPSVVHNPNDSRLGMELAAVVLAWAKGYKSQQTDRILRGVQAPPDGYTVTQKADREIVDPKKYKTLALEHLTPDEYEETLTPAFGAVETVIREKAPRGEKKAAIDAFKQRLIDEGAVKVGQPYSFLRAKNSKDKSENTQQPTN